MVFVSSVLLGLSVATVYKNCILSDYGELSALRVHMAYVSPFEGQSSVVYDVLNWAESQKATIIYTTSGTDGSPGTAVYAGSSWFVQSTGISSFNDADSDCAVISKKLPACYIAEGVLLPNCLDLQTTGYIDENNLPAFLQDTAFFYPLGRVSRFEGTLITDSREIESLQEILIEAGYEVTLVSLPTGLTLTQIFDTLMERLSLNIVSRAAVFAGISLMACSCLFVLRRIKDRTEEAWTRHLFGLSKLNLFSHALTLCVALNLIQLFCVYCLIKIGYSFMGTQDEIELLLFVELLYAIIDLTALFGLKVLVFKSFDRREGLR